MKKVTGLVLMLVGAGVIAFGGYRALTALGGLYQGNLNDAMNQPLFIGMLLKRNGKKAGLYFLMPVFNFHFQIGNGLTFFEAIENKFLLPVVTNEFKQVAGGKFRRFITQK